MMQDFMLECEPQRLYLFFILYTWRHPTFLYLAPPNFSGAGEGLRGLRGLRGERGEGGTSQKVTLDLPTGRGQLLNRFVSYVILLQLLSLVTSMPTTS